ncbi:hypothetical protein HCA15_14055 [Listeria booriae]|uniref:hypothetical protein n=1 Tax=Listeria booriae TaxID=1552123 RepID=UPI00162494F3|nr:hypothetical protein [Listeria booriae]MBC1235182.1 hypothetical protein [Listeria booriae]MBC1945112.1 hypothetical protein [Listeria booriae]MBC6167772.1 hypothetical protein [Listeria booriae]
MEIKHGLLLEHAKKNKTHYKKIIEIIDQDRNSKDELMTAGYTEDEAFKTLFILNGAFLSILAGK